MLDFQEKFVLNSMIKSNGTSNLNMITDEYKRTIDLRFNDVLNEGNKSPRWMNLIRKAHHSLKDKQLITGYELGEWSLTPQGFQLANELLNSRSTINKIVFYANEDIANQIQNKEAITLGTLYPVDNSIPETIASTVQGILVIETKIVFVFKLSKFEMFDNLIYLEICDLELLEENFDNTKQMEKTLEIYLRDVVQLAPVGLSTEEEEPPQTLVSSVVRRIRDTPMSQKLKQKYNNHCQICGSAIIIGVDRYYSEAHHLKPLGRPHFGPDIESNLIVLCPNHHAEFDGKSISINPETLLIEHIESNNQYIKKTLKLSLHKIDLKFIAYHHELFCELLQANKK
ncbi:HNH endonuclease [Paenibacillus validus]|uniref:HNH endonuclease n=1 Tax=Paenibacillus validus TaxID=44253 RepID=UPI000FD97D52|nr:HNH endonuclease [Paenibacillus validus]MED4599668.1 HNH endonuclease [Paenibacillus validus]MED4604568.1 HNH endonuclease [Paenibacillus validus]